MDNPDSVVPLGGFCENCGHFAGRHQDLRCHFPQPDENLCPCPGMMWHGEMYMMDMQTGPTKKIASKFVHLKAFWFPADTVQDCENGHHSWTKSGNGPCVVCSKPAPNSPAPEPGVLTPMWPK